MKHLCTQTINNTLKDKTLKLFCLVQGLAAILMFNTAKAQVDTTQLDYEMPKKYVIEDVKVTGINFADKNQIINESRLTRGKIVSIPGDDAFRQAVKRLWAWNAFDMVDIKPVKLEGDKVWIEIILTERPKVQNWDVKGVKKGQAKDIKEKELTLRRGSSLSDYLIKSNVEKIKKFYAEKGYLNAEVDVDVQRDSILKNAVNLVFNVNRKNKVKIKEITFEGNTKIKGGKLRAAMKDTKQRGFAIHSIFKSRKFVESKYEEDKNNIIKLYNKKGYRDAEILTDSVYRISENRVGIKMKVTEGRRYYFRNISWVGNTKFPSQALSEVLRIKKGDVYDKVLLNERLVTEDQSVLTFFYQDNGYIFSQMTPVETNVVNDSIDVEVQVREGDQARINRVTIAGNTKTNEHVIRRELRTVPGDLFSVSKFKESVRMLQSMKYFDPEELGKKAGNFIRPNSADGSVDVHYELTEVSNDQFELSGGWGANMFIGSVGVTFTNFSARRMFDLKAWRPVPTGDGQTLSLRFQTNGKRYQQFSVNFMEPWLGGRKPVALSIGAYYMNQTSVYNPYYDSYSGYGYGSYGYNYGYYYNYDSDEYMRVMGFSAGLSHRLKWPDHLFTLSYNLTLQRYQLRNWTGGFIFSTGNSNNFSLNVAFGRNSIENPIFPKAGSSFSIGLQLTPPYSLFSPKRNFAEMKDKEKYKWIEYHKWTVNGTFFTPIFENLVLMARADFGYLGYYNKKWGYSPFEGFVVGGGGMTGYVMYGQDIIALRGYEDNSLTPYNNSKNAYEGNVYDKFTLELRYPVIMQPASQIFVLTFLEAGNCWNSIDKFNPFDTKRSVGVGVRVNLNIVGTLGLDWGYGLDRIAGRDMNRGQLHFVMGKTF